MPRSASQYRQAYDDLYLFAKYILGYDRLVDRVHRPLCERLQNIDRGQAELILYPRSFFKSRIAAIAYPLWRLVRDPDDTGFIDTHTLTLAKAHLREIKAHIQSGKLDFYSRNGLPMYDPRRRWTEEEIEIAWRNPNVAMGTPSLMIGSVEVPKVGFHFGFIVEDDLHNDENTSSREQIERVVDHHRQLKPLEDLGRKCRRVMTGTRWTFGDLYEHVVEQEGWPVMDRGLYGASGVESGDSIFHEEFTPEVVTSIRKVMGAEKFAAQMLNSPISSETAVFTKDMLRFYSEGFKPEGMKYQLLDPAFSERVGADETAIVQLKVSPGNQIFVVNAVGERMEARKVVNRFFQMAQDFDPDIIGVEKTAQQLFMKYEFQKLMTKAGKWWPIKDLIPGTGRDAKAKRIRGLAAVAANGDLLFAPGLFAIVDQLLRFPKGLHDDMADALSYILQIAFPGGTPGVYDPDKIFVDRGKRPDAVFTRLKSGELLKVEDFSPPTPDWYNS